MQLLTRFSEIHSAARANKWYHYFAIFCRVTLACGFIPSGIVKIMGERFTALPDNHPLGHYLEALHHTGYYYPFLGVLQLITAFLLLIPRTALLGALLYFPIIVNICILAYATRFEGTRITTLMVLANLFLLCWDYDRLKPILSHKQSFENRNLNNRKTGNNKFPLAFFAGVLMLVSAVIIINRFCYEIRPGNSSIECLNGCAGNSNPKACENFCNCIYNQGQTLEHCLEVYEQEKQQ